MSGFYDAVKVVSYYFHVSFLETCKSYGLCPTGLSIRKKPFIEFESNKLKVFWKETLENTEKDLLEALCIGICERMFSIEKKFWYELYQLEKNTDNKNFKEWLVKLLTHLERKMKNIIKIKRKKWQKLSSKFVSPNVINLSKRHLFKDEISLLSNGLKFIPMPKHVNKALIKEELETYGRKLRIMWHYCSEDQEITINPLKKK